MDDAAVAIVIAAGAAATLGFGLVMVVSFVFELIRYVANVRRGRKFIEYIPPDTKAPTELSGAQVIQFVKKERTNGRKP